MANTPSDGGRGGGDPVAQAGSTVSADGGSVGRAGSGSAGTTESGGTGGVLASAGSGGEVQALPAIPVEGLALWLRADLGVKQANGSVSEWQDQSGNQSNAGQSAANVRPTFQATGLNGKPTIDFSDGQFFSMPPGFGDFSSGLAGFLVVKPSDPKCASMIELSNGSEVDDIALSFSEGAWGYEVLGEDKYDGQVATDAASLYSVVQRSTGVVVVRVNANLVLQTQFMLPKVTERQENFLGNTLYGNCNVFAGQISEVILYQRAVSDKELLKIEAYLRDRWALPVSGNAGAN